MSWDVLFQDLPPGVSSIDEIPDDFEPGPLCSHGELVAKVRLAAPDVDFSDPRLGKIEADGFSIEVSVEPGDPVDSVMLHVRGGDAALGVVQEIAAALGRPAIDCDAGTILDFSSPAAVASLKAWREYRDRVVRSSRA